MTISDFESKAIILKDRVLIDDDTRFLLLHEAANFQEFNKLQFDTNLLVFLNHSKYLFNFFEELANESVCMDTIKAYDFYAQFEEHLAALEHLEKNYKALLDKHYYADRINLQGLYKINHDYIMSQESIHAWIDGFLSSYELDLFAKCGALIPTELSFVLNTYNIKLKQSIETLGFELKVGYSYRINLFSKMIVSEEKIAEPSSQINVKVFNTRLSQISFIFSQIDHYIKEGIPPEEIVVVLPDESFVPFLKKFDRVRNLNFAMGFSLKQSKLYKRIEAIESYMKLREVEERLRIKRVRIPDEMLDKIETIWQKKVDATTCTEVINAICGLDEKESQNEKIQETIFRFSDFLSKLKLYNLEQVLKLFLNRLGSQTNDDIGGGIITVMGVLETRGSQFRGVIVPDFNDNIVPKINNKDIFLNTQIRTQLGLPTAKDRENLQRFYYHRLFSSADRVAISCLENEKEMPSRFLDELGLSYKLSKSESNNHSLLFKSVPEMEPCVGDTKEASYILNKSPLSATKLKILLTCKRKFYHKYIEGLKEADNDFTQSNANIGLLLHRALEHAMVDDATILGDEKRLYQAIEHYLHQEICNLIDQFSIDIWLERLKNFVKNEVQHYHEGYRIFKKEEHLSVPFEGYTLQGTIDRIDKKDHKLHIIDYKSGNVKRLIQKNLELVDDYQLEFYYLLASTLGNVKSVAYYDLKNAEYIDEFYLDEKLNNLKSILKEYQKPITTFDMCEKLSHCLYCPYNKLCLRQN